MKRLTKDQIMHLHQMICACFGTDPALRDDGLLESAIYSVEQTFLGEPLYQTTLERGARLGFALMKNHAFVDGNKRIGTLAMLVYCSLCGICFSLSDADVISIGLGVASGEWDYERLLAFLKEKQKCQSVNY